MRVLDPGHDLDPLRLPAIRDSERAGRRGQTHGNGMGRPTIEDMLNGRS